MVYTNIYSRWPCHASLWASLQGWGISVFRNSTVLTLRVLSVIISTGRPFHTRALRVLDVHINVIRGINIHITEVKTHISYSKNHDSTLFSYYFYMWPLPTLAHIIAKGSTFSINSPSDITIFQKNCLDVLSTGSFPFPMSMGTHIRIPYTPMAMETQLGFKRHRDSHSFIHSS